MRQPAQLVSSHGRILTAVLALTIVVIFSGPAMAKGGGGGHGGGGHGGRGESSGGEFRGGDDSGGHGGRHGGRHGSIVRSLPGGHIEVSHRGSHVFFHEGRFFDRHRDGFIVIGAPIGIVVPSLPATSLSVSIGGVGYFVADDNYFHRSGDGFVAVEAPHR